MARTARHADGGDALSELMREAGAAPRRRGPRGPRHRAKPSSEAKAGLPGGGKLRRISVLSAGGVVIGGLMIVLLAPTDPTDVIPGVPLAPPSLTIAPQAVEVPDDAVSSPAPPGPPGGSVAPPPPLSASMNGSETPSPKPAPVTSTAAPEYSYDPRAEYHDYGWYYDYWNRGGYDGGGRQPQWDGSR